MRMDEFVKEKLELWQLSALEELFEENFIDQEAFMLLDTEAVTELIKPIGLRMKFLANLRKMRNQDLPSTSGSSSPVPTSPGDTSVAGSSPGSSPGVSFSSPGPSGSSHGLSSSPGPSGSSPGPSISSPGPSTSSDVTFASPPQKRFRPDFNVRSLLQETSVGQTIIEEIQEGTLSRKNRLAFVRIAVAKIIERYGDRPKCEVKQMMAKAIVDEFPSLKDEEGQGYEAWYTPGKGHHSATGWIEERLRNARRNLKRTTPAVDQRATNTQLITAKLPESELSDEEFERMSQWLRHNVEPVQQVSTFMEKTAVKRAQSIHSSSEQSCEDILKEFPRLFDTPGMMEQDFRALFSEVADKLCLVWTTKFAEEVLNYESLQGRWHTYLHVDTSKVSDDNRSVVALAALPCALPSGRKGKKRASIDEALASYMDVQPIGTNLPKYLEDITNKQPYVLVTGSLLEPSQVFTIVERRALVQPTVLKAVDVCFKTFYVLNLAYPWQCASTWEFLQKVVYGLDDSGRKGTSSAVIAMRTALKKA